MAMLLDVCDVVSLIVVRTLILWAVRVGMANIGVDVHGGASVHVDNG